MLEVVAGSTVDEVVIEFIAWLRQFLVALFFLIGIGVGGVTWICILYSKNSSRFW